MTTAVNPLPALRATFPHGRGKEKHRVLPPLWGKVSLPGPAKGRPKDKIRDGRGGA